MQKLLLVCCHSENRATSQIWKQLPNMVFPPIWGKQKGRRSEHASYPGLFFRSPGSAPIWGGKKIEFRDWTKLHFVRKCNPPYFSRAALGIIFQDATFSDFMRVIHATFKALLKILKSVILSPPCFLSPIIVDFLILEGFPSQMKLEIIELISLISCSGITSTDVL